MLLFIGTLIISTNSRILKNYLMLLFMGTLLISTKNHTFQEDPMLLFMGTFLISKKKYFFFLPFKNTVFRGKCINSQKMQMSVKAFSLETNFIILKVSSW